MIRFHDAMLLSAIQLPRMPLANWLMIGLAIPAAMIVLRQAMRFWRLSRGQGGILSQKLFVSLCQAHELDQTDKRLLSLLAKSHRLQQPASIFLRPELFTAEKTSAQFLPHRPQIESLRRRLFGSGN